MQHVAAPEHFLSMKQPQLSWFCRVVRSCHAVKTQNRHITWITRSRICAKRVRLLWWLWSDRQEVYIHSIYCNPCAPTQRTGCIELRRNIAYNMSVFYVLLIAVHIGYADFYSTRSWWCIRRSLVCIKPYVMFRWDSRWPPSSRRRRCSETNRQPFIWCPIYIYWVVCWRVVQVARAKPSTSHHTTRCGIYIFSPDMNGTRFISYTRKSSTRVENIIADIFYANSLARGWACVCGFFCLPVIQATASFSMCRASQAVTTTSNL